MNIITENNKQSRKRVTNFSEAEKIILIDYFINLFFLLLNSSISSSSKDDSIKLYAIFEITGHASYIS